MARCGRGYDELKTPAATDPARSPNKEVRKRVYGGRQSIVFSSGFPGTLFLFRLRREISNMRLKVAPKKRCTRRFQSRRRAAKEANDSSKTQP
jgi:hypothetical protein